MKCLRRQTGGHGGQPPKTPEGYPQWSGLSPLMQRPFANYLSDPQYSGLGGYSNVLKFQRGGGTPLQLVHVIKFGDDAQFAQVMANSPELKRLYNSFLRKGFNKQQARNEVHRELARRFGLKPPEVSLDLRLKGFLSGQAEVIEDATPCDVAWLVRSSVCAWHVCAPP